MHHGPTRSRKHVRTGKNKADFEKSSVILSEATGRILTVRIVMLDIITDVSFLKGIGTTLSLTGLAVLLGTPLGIIFYMLSMKGFLVIRQFTKLLLWLVSGLPAIIIIMSLYYYYYRDLKLGGFSAALTGFVLVFAESVCRNISRYAGRIDNGKLTEDYRLLNIDGKEFYRVLKKKKGRDLAYDFKADVINTLKYSSVVGYIAVYDMTKVFDTMRNDRLETYMPLLATTLAYLIIIKLIELAIRVKK